jgi:HSP20 family molecular chaperone IbpA
MTTRVVRNDRWPAREIATEWPPFAIEETEDGYVFCAAVPGFAQEEVTVRVGDGRLSVHGEARGAQCGGGFDRVFVLGSKIDKDAFHHTVEDGRIKIVLKKVTGRARARPFVHRSTQVSHGTGVH